MTAWSWVQSAQPPNFFLENMPFYNLFIVGVFRKVTEMSLDVLVLSALNWGSLGTIKERPMKLTRLVFHSLMMIRSNLV